MVSTVNCMVFCFSNIVNWEDLMFRILTMKTKTKGHKEILERVGFVCYLGCAGGIMGVHICPNSSVCTH